MAERRMISKSMLMDNDFLSLNNDEKSLYLYLLVFADDDGFVKRSIMIDSILHVSDNDYNALENKGLIISENNEIKVITHWNTLETIREKLYTPTVYLDFRSQLFLKVDFSYTKDPKEPQVFTSADNWIKQGRPKNIKDFKPLIQQHLKEVQSEYGTSTVTGQDKDSTSTSPDKNRLDKNSIDKSSTEQSSSDQQRAEKAISASTTTASSNGGMGENSSSSTSISSLDNNATSESGENSGLNVGVNNEVNYLLDYANSLFSSKVPSDNERLNVQLTDLLNQYRPEFIKQALDSLAKQVGNNYPSQQIPSLLVGHLADTVKQVTVNQ